MNKLLVHSVFENIVSKYQQKAAIEYQEKTLTYGQVNRFANHVAYSLISQGVQPQDVMAVYLPSCPEYVVSIIGINKAGGAFMPIDIGTPEERLKYLLGKVEPSILITDKESISTLSSEIVEGSFKSVLLLDHDEFFNISLQNGQVLEAQEDLNENPKVEIDSEGRNYILYTSGSTGNPKVIAGRHKSLSHFIHWEMTEFEMGSSDKVSQLAPNSFDVSLRDIFVPLLSGGTLCIPDQSIKLNSHKLLEWVINSELTLVHCVPSLFRLIMEELKSPESGGMIPQLKYFLLGGDALYGRDVNAWKALEGVSNIQLVNIYGPTETTLAKLFYRVEDREYPATEIIPLGIPISNATVLILNEKNELCDAGEPGRIIIKTPFISNGYYRDQELTKEKFVQNPLHNDFEDTVYDTGDLGKYIANGNIQFLGRADNQVKINGNRVELFEIETVLAKHESFAEVVVGVVENEDEKLIVAYYKGETEIKVSDMEDYLTNFLPIYMHPSQYMHLEEFPLNKNGKVDRAACNKLFSENKRTNVSTSSQVTDVELTEDQTLLKNIFAEVLKLDNVGLNDSFFDLGGTSLKGIRIISRIYKEFGVLFKLPDLFANPSVAEFDQLIKAEKGDDTNEASNTQKKSSPITPLDEKQEFYEVSHAQKRLWLLHQFEDGRMAYNVPRTFLLEGELNVSALKFAMSEIVAHHETLRTSIVAVDGTPMQQIHSEVELDFRELDYSNSLNKEEDINYLLKTEVIAPFSLEDQSLIRIHLIKLDSDLHFFAYCMHHIISDAWSSGVIFKELQTYYKNYVDGETESLPALRIQYKDYAAWQNGELLKEGISSHKEYWHSKFNKEITALDFPTDRARPEVTTYNGENKWIFIEEKVFNKLKTVSDGKSLYASLMATLKLLLYKYTNQTDIILGAAVAGRDYEDLHDQIGFYVNTLAFRTDFEENDTFEQLLDKVNSTILEGYEHQIYPFDKLVDDLELKRETGRNPMFDIMTTFWNDSEQQQIPQLDGLQIQNYNTDYKVSKFDLTFTFVTFETELEVLINYNTDLFDDSTIDRILDHFSKLLETVVDNMDAKLKDLSPVSEEEQQKLMSDFQGSTIAYSKESGIQDLFLKVAKENSSLTGLILENGESFTYGELASRAMAIAANIKERIGTGKLVGLLLDRNESMVLSMLGTLMSGNSYVPIDKNDPQARKDYILSDAQCDLIVTSGSETYDDTIAKVDVSEFMSLSDSNWSTSESVKVSSSETAYVIYTSGSTGKPNGVEISHGNVVSFLSWAAEEFGESDYETVYGVTSCSFDQSVFELYHALTSGKQVKLLSSVQSIATALQSESSPILLNTVPSAVNQLLRVGADLSHVSALNMYGEPVPSYVYDNLPFNQIEVRNLYGPSETTTYSTVHQIQGPEKEKIVGKPIGNTEIYVLDDKQNLVPMGVWGEICISGAGLSSGYLGNPDLTAQKYIPHPFKPGERLYKTGDIGRWKDNGDLEYFGNVDDLANFKGYQIDLSEIQQIIQGYENIEEAIVVDILTDKGEQELVAYYTTNSYVDEVELRNALQNLLPFYKAPNDYVKLDKLPYDEHGNIKRDALRKDAQSVTTESHSLSITEVELLEIWQDVLQRDEIDINDNFFKLGGHSLKAMKVLTTIKKKFGLKIKLSELFKQPTIKKLAASIDARKSQVESENSLLV